MSHPYEQAIRASKRSRNNDYWAKQTIAGWAIGKWVIAFYLVSAFLLPLVVGLLVWGIPS